MTSKAETCYIALLAKLVTVAGLGTLNGSPYVSRRLEDPTKVQWENCPALFINQTGEEIQASKGFEGVTAKQVLMCDLYLYVAPVQQEVVCSTALNDMIQNIRTALYPDASSNNSQTLGGIVSHCYISGKIEIIEGVLNGQAIAIIPVKILTNI